MSRPTREDIAVEMICDIKTETAASLQTMVETLQAIKELLVDIRSELTELNTTADNIQSNTR